jgi:hypothetical protein
MIETRLGESFSNYYTYIKDSKHWAELRARIREEREDCCEVCSRTFGLDVHHLRYTNLGFEEDGDVLVLCRTCHQDAHDGKDELAAVGQARKEGKPVWKYHKIPEVKPICTTCWGQGDVLIKHGADERTDHYRPCPDCKGETT